MNKVIVIGIDGMDPFLVERWLEFMPHFKMIRDSGSFYSIQSTYPPDSICAWTSIFTGRNPVEHGLLDSIDYLSQKWKFERRYNLEGKTFWDIASKRGKRVCIINPFLAYPAWEVNGVMVSGPVFEDGKISAYPQEILDRLPFPPLGGWVDFPDEKALKEFILKAKDNTQRLADTSLETYKQIPSDLFFLTFLTLDRIQHFLWRFTDKEDYTYPGENPFADAIREFYILFDRIVGNFMDVMLKDTFLLILSDHGHRRRCTNYVNLNEFLRKKGYLSVNASGVTGRSKMIIEKSKVFGLRMLHKLHLQDVMYKVARLIPHRKSLRKSSYLLDKEKSLASAYELWGTNPFGGIEVKKGDHYEALRSKIIGEIESLNESLGKKIVLWAKRKEDLYSGEYIDKYPDIIFELDEEYGVNWDLFAPLITENYTHRKISGGHSKEAVLGIWSKIFAYNHQIEIPRSIVEFKSFVLKLLADENTTGK